MLNSTWLEELASESNTIHAQEVLCRQGRSAALELGAPAGPLRVFNIACQRSWMRICIQIYVCMYAGYSYVIVDDWKQHVRGHRIYSYNVWFVWMFSVHFNCVEHVCMCVLGASCLVYINEVSCLFHACHKDCMSSVFVKCCGDVGLWMLGMVHGRSAR